MILPFLILMSAFAMAQAPIACMVDKFEDGPTYESQTFQHYKSLMASKETCTYQEENSVYKRSIYVSKDRSTICQKELDKSYRQTRYFCVMVVKFENGRVMLANLKDHDCNGTAFNMVLKVKETCPM